MGREREDAMKILDAIVVVDVESTCWDGAPPPGQMSEIIEIGACLLNLDLSVGPSKSILVRPERSSISPFCTELTTITQDMVDRGVSFHDACRTLAKDFGTKDRPWASYGDYDRNQFNKVCTALGVRYPFGSRHINIKTLACFAAGLREEVGMGDLLNRMGIPLLGTHHRAEDDAKNIATILASVLKKARARV